MLFSSNVFLLLFLPIVVLLNTFLKTKYSNVFLLLASLFFYAWGEPIYILLMALSVCLNWGYGLWIAKAKRTKKLPLILCLISNLAILGYFKYLNFLADTINRIVGSGTITVKEIALPIGISFFTFQALSYVIDLYRGKCEVQKNLLHLALYISFFPQLIAGPIVRYTDVYEQIKQRKVELQGFAQGVRRFIYGLGKKVILANAMAEMADLIFALPIDRITTTTAWLGAIVYAMQIYYDFSGYSDMAIGLGKMFGFHFLENFSYPYSSCSVREFWQRWHISLGTWFREYVYIPLGGNRKGVCRTCCHLMLVFLLTGLWHGASWNFVIWGLYYGVFQVIERIGLRKILEKCRIIGWFYCMAVVLFGWVLFRSDTVFYAMQYIGKMVTVRELMVLATPLTLENIWMIVFAVVGCGGLQKLFGKIPKVSESFKNSKVELVYLGLVLIYCFVLLAAGTYNPFIYFRF